jgi:hypothetical protein
MQNEYAQTIGQKNRLIADLQAKIDRLEIDASQKEALTSDLVALGENRSPEAGFREHYPWLDHLMESDLFQGLSERIERVMRSDAFDDLKISENDLEMLTHAQRDLMKMLDNPDDMRKILSTAPVQRRLKMLEERRASDRD